MRLRHIAILCFLLVAFVAKAQEEIVQRENIIGRVVRYFRESNSEVPYHGISWGVIGGPYYSSDVGFGVGLVAAGQYRTAPATPPGNISFKVTGSTTLSYGVSANGLHIFPDNNTRLQYTLDFNSLPTYFWGIGYDAGYDTGHKTKYTDRRIGGRIDALNRVAGPLFLGGLLQFSTARADHVHDLEFWNGLPRHVTAFGLGAELVFDTRDVVTEPHNGVFLSLCPKVWPHWMGNSSHTFSSVEFIAAWYKNIWRGGVLASRFNTLCTIGDTPWTLMPTFGNSTAMRGYYAGQYRDKCEFDVTVELRQRLWSRSGAVAWVGFGSVFPYPSAIQFRHLLPNAGVGYRWEFKNRVNVRLDVGFGTKCYGVEFGINEAF